MTSVRYKIEYNRKNKLRKDGTALVQVRIGIGKNYIYRSTGVYVKPGQWNNNNVVNHPDAAKLNMKIRRELHKLQDIEFDMLRRGERIIPQRFAAYINDTTDSGNFLTWMEKQIDAADIRYGTRQQHMAALHHLQQFGKINTFADLTIENIQSFDIYLRNLDLKQHTIYSIHKRVRVYVNKAIPDYIAYEDNPYLKFKSKRGQEPVRRFLLPDDIEKLEKKEMPIKRLEQVKDMFLFSCYTGISYSDLVKLTPEHIQRDADGDLWLVKSRQKTDVCGSVYLIPRAIALINKYNGKHGSTIFPVITNQCINAYLFATSVTLANGVPLQDVSFMLGHRSIKTTEVYAKILPASVKKSMKEVGK